LQRLHGTATRYVHPIALYPARPPPSLTTASQVCVCVCVRARACVRVVRVCVRARVHACANCVRECVTACLILLQAVCCSQTCNADC
jgi:hypothetical protein